MDFDLDGLISSDGAKNAKASAKFQPKAKPKPKLKAQPSLKSVASPSTQSAEAVTVGNSDLKRRSEEEQTRNTVNHISKDINHGRLCSFEKSEEENADARLQSESLSDVLPKSTTITDGDLEKESGERELSNHFNACTNLGSLAQVDPLMGEEAAIVNNSEEFQMGDLTLGLAEGGENFPSCEPLDMLFESKTCSGRRVGKFKPKPKVQTRKVEQNATIPNQDKVVSVSDREDIESAAFQTDYTENGPVPPFTEDEIHDSSSVRTMDSVPTRRISDFDINEEPINWMEASQVDSVTPAENLDAVPENPTTGLERMGKGKKKTRKGLNPTLNQDKVSESNNQDGRCSGRLKRRARKTLELVDESGDEAVHDELVHENEDNGNDDEYTVGNESLNGKKGGKSKKPLREKEKSVRKHKNGSEVPVESTKAAKKKFSHRTRRNKRRVNPDLLKIPEDELELHNLPMKELIRLAEYRERMTKKDASMSGTPAVNQSAGNFSNLYDENEAFTHDMDSAYEHDYSMEADNATYYNYRTHMKMTPRVKWSKQDTELFYEAIQQFGTDLSMIKECFPGRTREQVKSKYKKEEREHPARLNDALSTRAKGISHFEVVIERLKQARGSESDKDDPINMTGVDEETVAADVNEAGTTKPEHSEKVKDTEPDVSAIHSPTKSNDSEDDMFRWDQYKSEI